MAITFEKLLKLLNERGISIYHLKRDKVVGTATLDKLRKKEGNIDIRSIDSLCKYLNVSRSAYYRWVKYPKSNNELRNERLSTEIQRIHNQHPDMGYRRIRFELDGHKGIHVNDK